MSRCGGGSCTCLVKAGEGAAVSGSGTYSDPYMVTARASGVTTVLDTSTIDLSITGSGSPSDPYSIVADLSANLADLLDVGPATPTTGQVLGWNGSAWVPVAAATATPGLINTGCGLTGDGSSGSPLAVVTDPVRGIQCSSGAVGLTDAMIAAIGAGGVPSTGGHSNGEVLTIVTGSPAWAAPSGSIYTASLGIQLVGSDFRPVYGSAANTVTQGNDSRLSNARTPTAHASTHAAAGTDPVTLTMAQITGLIAALNSTIMFIREVGGVYAVRSSVPATSTQTVVWIGADAPTIGGSYAINDVDVWWRLA
jgi:hypothetical protein